MTVSQDGVKIIGGITLAWILWSALGLAWAGFCIRAGQRLWDLLFHRSSAE